ncbi:MAG: hypothetical protein ACLRXA_23000 [Clostridium sp.]
MMKIKRVIILCLLSGLLLAAARKRHSFRLRFQAQEDKSGDAVSFPGGGNMERRFCCLTVPISTGTETEAFAFTE